MSALPDIAQATAARYAMLPPGAVTLALVSGGADSVALLRLLADGWLGTPRELSVLHVNHLLRGADSDADADFVDTLCASFGVPCRTVSCDVGAYATSEGLNLEDAGRRVRYRFAADELDARCAALGVPADVGRIAVAHTFDDRLETLLMRLLTGTGQGGLRSIAPVRGRVIRPLIALRHADITAYLEGIGQIWREDLTNTDTARQRGWVRHELLPLIESHAPGFATTIARTMDIVAEEDDVLSELAGALAGRFVRVEEGALSFDRAPLQTVPRALARRTVRAALVEAFPEASRLDFEHTEAIVDGLAEENFARDLPCGLRARSEYARLRISRTGDAASPMAPGLLDCPGTTDLGPAGTMEARFVAVGEVAPGRDRVSIDAGSVTWPLVVDGPRAGDRMRPLGLAGTKKVSDVLTDAKVPGRLRAMTPVVRDGERIVWVAGVRIAHECRVVPETERVAELVWRRKDAGKDEPSA